MSTKIRDSVRVARLACFAAVVGALTAGTALAAEPQLGEITVRAGRTVPKQVGRTSSGIPILEYELSYKVAYSDLDLASADGVNALRQRVRDAALSACADLDKLYPGVAPNRDCAATAEREAAAEVDAVVAVAGKR